MERHSTGLSTQGAPVLINRIEIVEIVGVHVQAERDLMKVSVAPYRIRFLLGARECGQQHASKNRYDRNDDEKLDQGEGGFGLPSLSHGMTHSSQKRLILATEIFQHSAHRKLIEAHRRSSPSQTTVW